jgi:SRSO17 transposase
MLEVREQPYVLAMLSNKKLMAPRGTITAEAMVSALPDNAWEQLSAGTGAKGLRLYDWTRVRLMRFQRSPWDHWLLGRRNRNEPSGLHYFVVFGPETTILADLDGVAGQRRTIEECFQQAKGEVGLNDYEVRNSHGWYRHITLATLALAYLAALRAPHLPMASGKANITSPRPAMA